ncbi:branched-chain amino acid ABC transporter substrate-binding protein [Bradyrhizobium ottawaense]|jgi:branched-chain amino acid transport system substrate-binding protein|uniref:Branched-chain amino acid ABC transporter substrate-binding protein n=2 Tax=Bradyrhizobium ottawaense TaxID=931866 RepID=A0A2U8P408_9BRAD|nr:branched-chain amino acid ABC transporter substrate-binding protein [Bradyrhizobium ottawaense]PDT71261.1 branched-chain amino acid ABC transporter substrate-binding protein [Bradyrhizobium ottawaense]
MASDASCGRQIIGKNKLRELRMRNGKLHLATALALALSISAANAQKKYDPGASDTEIKVGQTMPFSGPASAYSSIGKTQAAYFKMINDQGGVNGRKINLIQYDDAYSPPKAVEQIRKLVESDEVLLTFQIIGTPVNAAVQKYLNAKKVPQLFAATGASRFTDPKNFPWTMGFNPNYFVEGRIYGQYILKEHPNAKVGVLYQNDDLGKDYLNGIKAGLGDKAAKMIVTEASYEVSDPTVDSQVLKIKDAGADLFFSATTPKQAAQAIKKIAEMGWHPVQIVDINATSVGAVLKPAGLDAAKGLISVNYGKEPLDPTWKDDPGMKKYFDFMAKYYPDGDKDSNFNTYGYSTAQLLVHVLQQCGDNLTRENVMKQAASLKDVASDTALPGIKANTSPTDYRVNKQLQMMKFNGERWELFGPILEDAGPAG